MEEKAGNVTQPLMLFPFRYDGIYMRGTTSKMPQLIAGFGLLVIGLVTTAVNATLSQQHLSFSQGTIFEISIRSPVTPHISGF